MKAKKELGQHFLKNENIASAIANALDFKLIEKKIDCLEIGPGKGVLTKYLLKNTSFNLKVVELDTEAIDYLNVHLPEVSDKIIHSDVLKLDYSSVLASPAVIIGNIPYNITGPIFFKMLDYRDLLEQAVFMIQKEVADRIYAHEGSKVYGILSVLLQAYYDVEYLFGVDENEFDPPPKVKSAVLKLTKKTEQPDIEDFKFFKNVVKAAFNQRRKTLRNALSLYETSKIPEEYLPKRAEQLSVNDFIRLYKKLR